ncbi:hypothetical protein NDU88_011242 [Pleurodeles waltl]|uniref:Guanylate-binding protein/Atlastin C-terminal domain-containing protein n=1 Tax=Pleurodeles waltl TaxID=8319 RepID=A0AAV7Q069_PLEWA|nr:hypothetical protein NDU88_011242 [Pleurodeles waltl]
MAEVKRGKDGYQLNGRMFSSLAQTYVETILSGVVPCLENAVLSLATIENEAAVKEAAGHYASQMHQLVKFPAEVQELSYLHGKCEAEALQVYMRQSFKDENGQYQHQLMCEIAEQYGNLLVKNEDVSLDKCRSLLRDLSVILETNLRGGAYTQPGGYEIYTRDRDQVVMQLQASPNKGVKVTQAKFSSAKLIAPGEKGRVGLTEQEKKVTEEKNLQVEKLLRD